jgi:hypothetical protein
MTKKLTERSAWLAIAHAFDHEYSFNDPSLISRWGLCYAISQLCNSGRISTVIWLRMNRRIHSIKTAYGRWSAHKWPLDASGRVSRARAARRFAKQLTPK